MQCGRGVGCEAKLLIVPCNKVLSGILSLVIGRVLVLAIKVWYYMAVVIVVIAIVEVDVAWLLRCRGRVVVVVPLPLAVRSRMGRMNQGNWAMGQGAIVMWLKTIGHGRGGHSCKPNPYSGHD